MAINLANGRRLLTRHEGYSQEFADRFSLSGLGVFFFKRSNVFKHLFQANFLRRLTINMVRFLRGDFPLKPPPPPGYTHTYTSHPPPPPRQHNSQLLACATAFKTKYHIYIVCVRLRGYRQAPLRRAKDDSCVYKFYNNKSRNFTT